MLRAQHVQSLETQLQAAQQTALSLAAVPQQLEELPAKAVGREQELTRLQTELHAATQRNLELERQFAAATAADAVRQQMTEDLMRRLDTFSAGSGSRQRL